MSIVDDILSKRGLTQENLSKAERESLNSWLEVLSKNEMTVDKIRNHIEAMKYAVEQELVSEPEFNYILVFKVQNRKQIFLKARLKNYMLLEAFLASPERARQALKDQLKRL